MPSNYHFSKNIDMEANQPQHGPTLLQAKIASFAPANLFFLTAPPLWFGNAWLFLELPIFCPDRAEF
jgi:hypothetical protein